MRHRHRPFHSPAVSGIILTMVCVSRNVHNFLDTNDLTLSSNRRQTGNLAVVNDFV